MRGRRAPLAVGEERAELVDRDAPLGRGQRRAPRAVAGREDGQRRAEDRVEVERVDDGNRAAPAERKERAEFEQGPETLSALIFSSPTAPPLPQAAVAAPRPAPTPPRAAALATTTTTATATAAALATAAAALASALPTQQCARATLALVTAVAIAASRSAAAVHHL